MNNEYIYPGTFGPPHIGHLQIVREAAKLFSGSIVTILCSVNEGKKPWFAPDDCKRMWRAYRLPRNVRVMTLDEFHELHIPGERIVMIRGIRGPGDMAQENSVAELNRRKFGIRRFFYIYTEDKFADISSTTIRTAASGLNLSILAEPTAPLVVSELLERVLQASGVYMAVGRPGSGKSTFLRVLAREHSDVEYIDTDVYADSINGLLCKRFPGQDLIRVAVEQKTEFKATIAETWIRLLRGSLQSIQPGKLVILEIPYGLQPGKRIYRLVGGRILYFDTAEAELAKRLDSRGTPEHKRFIDQIPDWGESCRIARRHKLEIRQIISSSSLEELRNQTNRLYTELRDNHGISNH